MKGREPKPGRDWPVTGTNNAQRGLVGNASLSREAGGDASSLTLSARRFPPCPKSTSVRRLFCPPTAIHPIDPFLKACIPNSWTYSPTPNYSHTAMSSHRAKLAELRALRAAGKKRLSTYEIEEQGDIYEEVDDEGYKKVIRDRLDEDDFVVDDNGAGYADDGREVWNEPTAGYYDDSEDDELPARGKAAKRKREEEKQRQEKINNGISKYFNKGNATTTSKPKV